MYARIQTSDGVVMVTNMMKEWSVDPIFPSFGTYYTYDQEQDKENQMQQKTRDKGLKSKPWIERVVLVQSSL